MIACLALVFLTPGSRKEVPACLSDMSLDDVTSFFVDVKMVLTLRI